MGGGGVDSLPWWGGGGQVTTVREDCQSTTNHKLKPKSFFPLVYQQMLAEKDASQNKSLFPKENVQYMFTRCKSGMSLLNSTHDHDGDGESKNLKSC